MNSGVSLNNTYLSIAPINLNQKSQASNINNCSFMKMMMLINQDQNQNQQASNQTVNMVDGLNIMDLVTGKNTDLFKATDLNSMNLDLSKDESLNVADDKAKLNTLENFIALMNYMNFDNKKFVVEKSNPENLILEKNTFIDVNENKHYNNDIAQALEKTETVDFQSNFKTNFQSSSRIEKLMKNIEGNKEELKGKVDFNTEILSTQDPLIQNSNKIIAVTDEATQIRSQVLTQVKDKIIFIAKEDSITGNEIKQVTMELQPHNLGKVNIKMIFTDNKITVEIKALNEETQKILSTSVGELAKILSKTTESSISVVVKDNELQYERQTLNYNQNNDQRHNENYDEQHKHNKHNNHYYNENLNENDDDDDAIIFSELINLRSLKLQ